MATTAIKKLFPCEIAFVLGMIINSFALCLMIKSALGVSTLSSVPLVLFHILPKMSLGTWTTIIQTLTILLLVIVTRQPKLSYLLSFLIGIIFGFMMDGANLFVHQIPDHPVINVVCFLVGFIAMSIGASLFILCRLPIMPFDVIIRDLSLYLNREVKIVKTIYDACCVVISLVLCFVFLGHIVGIGIGTIIGVLMTGRLTQFDKNQFEHHFTFRCVTSLGRSLEKISTVRPKQASSNP